MAYVDLQKKFPQSDVGRVRLELLLSKLLGDKKAWAEANEEQMREPLTAAAKLGSSSAMELLGEFLRKRDPKASFDWLCAAAAQAARTPCRRSACVIRTAPESSAIS